MSLVEVTVEGHVAHLVLNRPEARNALSIELCKELVATLQGLDSDAGARCVVIAGAGDVFCAGADFAAVSGPAGLDFLPAFEAMLESVAHHRLPTIARIHGAALGGGLQLATVCDLRVCADDARLGIPSAKLGILVNLANIRRLVLLAGVAVAKEILMTGRTYDGATAARIGLVHDSVPAAALDATVAELAAEVAARAPLSVQGTKRAIGFVLDHLAPDVAAPSDDVTAIEALVAEAYASADLAEGIAAMTEKRAPRFEGR